jgi:hypothetical protein
MHTFSRLESSWRPATADELRDRQAAVVRADHR